MLLKPRLWLAKEELRLIWREGALNALLLLGDGLLETWRLPMLLALRFWGLLALLRFEALRFEVLRFGALRFDALR